MLDLADVNLLQANEFFKCLQRSFQILQIIVIGQWLHPKCFLGVIIRKAKAKC